MTAAEILQIVTEAVSNEVEPIVSTGTIMPSHHLRDDLNLDSVKLVGLSVVLEDEFDIIFDPIDMDLVEIFETVGSLADFIYNYISE